MLKRVLSCFLVLCMLVPTAAAVEITDESEDALRISDEFASAYPCGVFSLKSVAIETPEQGGRVVTKVVRQGGTSGRVIVTLKAIDISAKIGQDYDLVIPGFIFGKTVKGNGDNTIIENSGTSLDLQSDIYSLESDTKTDAATATDGTVTTPKTGLRAAKAQATGAESDRSKFTYTKQEQSQLTSLATRAALDYYSDAAGTEFTLTFDAGERVQEFYIDVVDNINPEADKQLLLVITDVSGEAAIGIQRETTVNITDNEPYEKPDIRFSADSYSAGGNSAEITLERTAGINYYAGGKIYTIDGSALTDEDYTSLSQSFLFVPGQTEIKLSVPVVPNRTSADKYFYVKVVPDESCTVTGNDRIQVWLRKPTQTLASMLSLSSSGELSVLADGEGITLGSPQTVYNCSASNYSNFGSSKAQFFQHSGGWYEVNIQHNSISAGATLNRTLYKSMLDSIYTNMTLYEIKHVNHFDVWIDALFTSNVKTERIFLGTKTSIPTFSVNNNLLYGRDGYDNNHPSLKVMDRNTVSVKRKDT